MKKTISVTLGGVIFNIEDDAYQRLDAYLASIKEYYKIAAEEKEILSDIESSIAEKFSQKINQTKVVITLVDVEEMIKIMGTIAEIQYEAEETDASDDGNISRETRKRLYRNPDDMIIAGVASGIAVYFGIDPVFVRVLFVALTFANGFGLLLYFILWLVVPEAKSNTQKLEMRGRPVNLNEIQEAVKKSQSKSVLRVNRHLPNCVLITLGYMQS